MRNFSLCLWRDHPVLEHKAGSCRLADIYGLINRRLIIFKYLWPRKNVSIALNTIKGVTIKERMVIIATRRPKCEDEILFVSDEPHLVSSTIRGLIANSQ